MEIRSVLSRRSWRRLFAALTGLVLAATVGTAPAEASFTPAPGSPLAVGIQPYSALAQDLDGDGRVDVATANGTSSNLSVFLGTAAGGFAAAGGSPFPTGSGPSGAAVADFNGDGRRDIAVSNYADKTVSVLLGQPGGGWAQEGGGVQAAPGAGAVAVADVNADGRPDLLVPDFDAGGVSVLLRQAGGGFAAENGSPPATGTQPRDLAAADFNGDGRPDMAVTNLGSDNVTVLLRQAGGGFAAENGSPFPVGTSPIDIAARDLNGDGRADLAIANYGSDNVSILLRQASGGFAADPASPIAAGNGTTGIVAPDLNGDGRADLAFTNNLANTLSVLLRRPGGGYEADTGSPISLPTGPSGIASADVDGDGRPDLVVTSAGANVLSVLLNRIPLPGSEPAQTVGAGSVSPPHPPSVVSVKEAALAVVGGGAKVSPTLERALARADLDARLRSAAATSRVAQEASQRQAVPDPAVERRLDSLAYGIPVTVRGSAGEVVAVSGALAIASRSRGGARIAEVELPPTAAELQGPSTVVRLPVDAKAAAEMQRSGIDEAALAVTAKEVAANELDSMSELGETESLRLQMAMDRLSKMMSTLSNMLQKISETSANIAGNLKRPNGARATSKAALRRRAGATAKAATATGHTAAALLAPLLRAHPTASPRATFGLKPCPKRCAYPRFATR